MKKPLRPTGRLLLPVLACGLSLPAAVAAPRAAAPAHLMPRATRPATVVSGRVTDEKGEGLPGATVLVKGTSNGLSTNANGEFKLDVPAGATLVISSVGYTAQEMAVTGTTVSVTLRQHMQQLSEAMVVGYLVQERQNVTGAVSMVGAQDVRRTPVASVGEAIQGGPPGGRAGHQLRCPGPGPGGQHPRPRHPGRGGKLAALRSTATCPRP